MSSLDVQYSGRPRPTVGTWGEVGWEELTDGVIVAGQPDGAPSWFPCNDHPSDKASFRIAVTADAGYHVVANGTLTERGRVSSRERWCFEQPEPMATYLATVQIGRYEVIETSAAPVRQLAAVPERLQGGVPSRLRSPAGDDGRCSSGCSGPTRSRTTRSS